MCMTGRRANTTTSLDVRQSDTRVQVDVGFIEVEHFLFGAGVIHQTLTIVKDFPPSANGTKRGAHNVRAPKTQLLRHTPSVIALRRFLGVVFPRGALIVRVRTLFLLMPLTAVRRHILMTTLYVLNFASG